MCTGQCFPLSTNIIYNIDDSEFCDGDRNLIITCMLYRGCEINGKDTLEEHLRADEARENLSLETRHKIQAREQDDKELTRRSKLDGNMLFKRGKFLDAVMKYSEALSTFSGRQVPELWLNRAAAYMKSDMYQEALEDALKARCLRPDWAKVYFRIGAACLHLGKLKLAENSVDMGLQLKPGDVEMLCLRMKIKQETRKSTALEL